ASLAAWRSSPPCAAPRRGSAGWSPSGAAARRRNGNSRAARANRAILAASGMGLPMEQKLVCDDRLDVARRLYYALCAQDPDRFIILCDAQGRILARHDAPTVSTTAAVAFLVRDNPRLN